MEWLRHGFFASGSRTRGEVLSFARPKESTQRKGRPVARQLLRFSLQTGFAREHIPVLAGEDAHPCASPDGPYPSGAAMLGAPQTGFDVNADKNDKSDRPCKNATFFYRAAPWSGAIIFQGTP
jgi:hypothetical protein